MKEPCSRCGSLAWYTRSPAHCSECCCIPCHNRSLPGGRETPEYRAGTPCPHTDFGRDFEAVREVMDS